MCWPASGRRLCAWGRCSARCVRVAPWLVLGCCRRVGGASRYRGVCCLTFPLAASHFARMARRARSGMLPALAVGRTLRFGKGARTKTTKNVGQVLAMHPSKFGPNSNTCGPNFGNIWAECRPNQADLGQCSADVGQYLGRIRQRLARLHRVWAELDQQMGRVPLSWADFRNTWHELGRTRPNLAVELVQISRFVTKVGGDARRARPRRRHGSRLKSTLFALQPNESYGHCDASSPRSQNECGACERHRVDIFRMSINYVYLFGGFCEEFTGPVADSVADAPGQADKVLLTIPLGVPSLIYPMRRSLPKLRSRLRLRAARFKTQVGARYGHPQSPSTSLGRGSANNGLHRPI